MLNKMKVCKSKIPTMDYGGLVFLAIVGDTINVVQALEAQ
jgi:hypothetical protein